MRPFGEVVAEPFEVSHTDAELGKLACLLEKLPGETRIVMEYTGGYGAAYRQGVARCGPFCLCPKCAADLQIWQRFHPKGQDRQDGRCENCELLS